MRKQYEKLHDPRDYHIADSKPNELSKEEMEQMRVNLFRRWPPFLSGVEQAIILFVYDRTVNYGRRWSYVSIETLVEGYPLKEYREIGKRLKMEKERFWRTLSITEQMFIDEGNHVLTAATGYSRRQIITGLQSLEKQGFLYRIMNNGQPEMALNPDAVYSYRALMTAKPGKK